MKQFGLLLASGVIALFELSLPFCVAQQPRTEQPGSTTASISGTRQDGAAVAEAKQDELGVCLQFVYRLDSGYLLTNNLPLPQVNCYEQLAYTHVTLNKPTNGTAPITGVILHDNRPDHCASEGCPVYLAVEGCPDSPGKSERCKNNWFKGIDDLGGEIKLGRLDKQGFYNIIVTHRGASSTYGWEARTDSYQNLTQQAKQESEAAAADNKRRAIALSLGLHSGQSQAQVKAILAAHAYHSSPVPGQLRSRVTESGPWNCASDGWKDGQWTTGCVSQKGNVRLSLVFELGRLYRDADTAALKQVHVDRLIYAHFEFAANDGSDDAISLNLVSRGLKKCNGEDDGDGVCLNF